MIKMPYLHNVFHEYFEAKYSFLWAKLFQMDSIRVMEIMV